MAYVDGYILTVPTAKLKAYQSVAQKAGKIWREHGALSYKESVGEDMENKWGVSFPKLSKAKSRERVIFAFVVYKNKEHRDRVNAKVMKDERLHALMDPKNPLFDMKQMAYGGFKTIVDL